MNDIHTRCRLHLKYAILPAIHLLGASRFRSREAVALMLAIAMQESRIQHRAQVGGPARGFYQFERGGGVAGVLAHASTKTHAEFACNALLVEPAADDVYRAIQYNDVLAAAFARLLLWASPAALPTFAQGPQPAWDYYLAQWRPGKPHPDTWAGLWDRAWSVASESMPIEAA